LAVGSFALLLLLFGIVYHVLCEPRLDRVELYRLSLVDEYAVTERQCTVQLSDIIHQYLQWVMGNLVTGMFALFVVLYTEPPMPVRPPPMLHHAVDVSMFHVPL